MKIVKTKNKKTSYFATAAVILVIALAIFFLQKSKVNPQIGINNQQAELKEGKYPKAPDFAGIGKWINSEPLTIGQLKGKVVLVDFWTYTCINCIRTLPYLKEWDKKYRDKGLLIVGIHTPEFEFEKKYENVQKAVNDYRIKYPVAQDNDYATWRSYENRFWPHKFLIDMDGYIRYDHIGEGAYEETEKMIQQLLGERMESLERKNGMEISMSNVSTEVDYSKIGTPEIYFGYQFDRGNLGYEGISPDSTAEYKIPPNPNKNTAYLSGQWKYNADNMELVSDEGEILLIFEAKKANIVAGSENTSDVYAYLDNSPLSEKIKGEDIVIEGNSSMARVGEFRLYNVVSAEDYGIHALDMVVVGKGFKIYTFTFG